MTRQQLYDLSCALWELNKIELQDIMAFRYKLIVDQSSHGRACVYARQTHKLVEQPDEMLKLKKLRDRLLEVLHHLDKALDANTEKEHDG